MIAMKTQILSIVFLLISILSFAQTDSTSLKLRRVPFQFTMFAPPLSTNGIYFYNTVNDISINTFIGVGAGSRFMEFGGFINANRLYSKGIQASGFANINGFDELSSNYHSSGIQASGFANINGNAFKGIQASGFANINQEASGILATGFANINQKVENTIEFSGFANISAKGNTRIQASGFANYAENVNGIQAAGFINMAKKVKGVQLSGFINVCDSLDGVALGFINIVKTNGYRAVEISTTDWSPIQVSYKMGTERLYNIYTISKLTDHQNRYALGFGFGHQLNLKGKSKLNFEITNHQEYFLFNPGFGSLIAAERTNNITQLKAAYKRDLWKGVCVNVGPTLNYGFSYDWKGKTYTPTGENIQPYFNLPMASTDPLNNWTSRFWAGFSAGISFH